MSVNDSDMIDFIQAKGLDLRSFQVSGTPPTDEVVTGWKVLQRQPGSEPRQVGVNHTDDVRPAIRNAMQVLGYERHPCGEAAREGVLDGLAGALDQCRAAGMTEAVTKIRAAALWMDPDYPIDDEVGSTGTPPAAPPLPWMASKEAFSQRIRDAGWVIGENGDGLGKVYDSLVRICTVNGGTGNAQN